MDKRMDFPQIYADFYAKFPIAYLVTDRERWIYANERAVQLLKEESVADLIDKPVYQCLPGACELFSGNPVDFPLEFREKWLSKNGESIYLKFTGIPLVENPNYIQFFVNEIKRMEEEFSDLLEEMAAWLAHEILNPLTSVKGFLELMQRPDGENREMYINIAKKEIEQIEQIVSQCILLRRPIQNKALTDLNRLMNETVSQLSGQGYFEKVHIAVSAIGPVEFYCEGSLIKEVFRNLLMNAIEAKATKISVQISAKEKGIDIKIADNGNGGAKSRWKKPGGSLNGRKGRWGGFGSLIINRIITGHDGKIFFHKEKEAGSIVHIQLPHTFPPENLPGERKE